MNEFSSDFSDGDESPEPAAAVSSPSSEVPGEAGVKDALAREADGDVLSKGVTSEGIDKAAVENAAADKIRREVSHEDGDLEPASSSPVGAIRTEALEDAQADIFQARTRAENDAAAAASGAMQETPPANRWDGAAHEVTGSSSTPEDAGTESQGQGGAGGPDASSDAEPSEMKGYSPYRTDYSTLAATSSNESADEPADSLQPPAWEMKGYAPYGNDYSALQQDHSQVEGAVASRGTPGGENDLRGDFSSAAQEVTANREPEARPDDTQGSETPDEDDPVRRAKNSRLMYEIRPGGPGEGGTRVYNSRR